MVLETKIWDLCVLIATGVLFPLGPLSQQSIRLFVCVLTMYINIYISIYLCNHLDIYCYTWVLTDVPTLIYYHMDHYNLLSCVSKSFHPNSEKPGFHHLPLSYLIVQFQYTYIGMSELLTVLPWEATVSIRGQCLCTISFAFSFIDWVHFWSYLGQYVFPQPLQ